MLNYFLAKTHQKTLLFPELKFKSQNQFLEIAGM
jgi:hypothetical protein